MDPYTSAIQGYPAFAPDNVLISLFTEGIRSNINIWRQKCITLINYNFEKQFKVKFSFRKGLRWSQKEDQAATTYIDNSPIGWFALISNPINYNFDADPNIQPAQPDLPTNGAP
jgi:hypothetical protein